MIYCVVMKLKNNLINLILLLSLSFCFLFSFPKHVSANSSTEQTQNSVDLKKGGEEAKKQTNIVIKVFKDSIDYIFSNIFVIGLMVIVVLVFLAFLDDL